MVDYAGGRKVAKGILNGPKKDARMKKVGRKLGGRKKPLMV